MDEALEAEGKSARQESEAIALPVPTWSIENWLLALLDEPDIDEAKTSEAHKLAWKIVYEQKYGDGEGEALKKAASGWSSDRLPSLSDGRQEVDRIW